MGSGLLLATGFLCTATALGCSSNTAATSAQQGSKSSHANGNAPAGNPNMLEILSEASVQLDFGAHAILRARLSDETGAAVAGEAVSFALLGRSLDSSLAALSATSETDGVAENTLLAGSMPATFRIDVSARGAADVLIDVAVSNAGFGVIDVTLDYDGKREVAQSLLYAQANAACGASRKPGDPSVTVVGDTNDARLLALPASVAYTVTAQAQSMDGTIVAEGCSEGGSVFADHDTKLDIQLVDTPLKLAGQFELQAQLDMSAPAAVLAKTLQSAAQALIEPDAGKHGVTDDEGRFLLDSLDGALRSLTDQAGAIALANELSDARMNPSGETPEHALSTVLAQAKTGPLSALGSLVGYTQSSLDLVHLFALLSLSSGKRPLAWRSERIEATALGAGASAPAVDLSTDDAAAVSASFAPAEDALVLASVGMRAQLGLLAAQTLTKVVGNDVGGHGEEIRTQMGCSSLSDWLSAQTFPDRAACDASCIASACDRAVTRLSGAGQSALVTLDMTRPELTLAGTITLFDADGDLIPDRLSVDMLTGVWEPEPSASMGDDVLGSATGAPATMP